MEDCLRSRWHEANPHVCHVAADPHVPPGILISNFPFLIESSLADSGQYHLYGIVNRNGHTTVVKTVSRKQNERVMLRFEDAPLLFCQ